MCTTIHSDRLDTSATVHWNIYSSQEIGLIADEKRTSIRDISRRRSSTQWNRCHKRGLVLWLSEERVGSTLFVRSGSYEYGIHNLQSSPKAYNRTHCCESDIVLGVLDCHTLGSIDDCCFRRIVPCEASARSDASRRSSGHERATGALLLKIWNEDLGGNVYCLHIDSKDPVVLLVGNFGGWL